MARPRDYRAEYARRVERGLARGLSRSQARGHPRPGEPGATAVPTGYDPRLEAGLKAVRGGKPLGKAARSIHVAPERLRGYLVQTGVVEKQGRRWRVVHDLRPRVIQTYSRGRALTVTVPGYEPAALVGRYLAAVKAFRDSNDPGHLAPFVGGGVTDVNGTYCPFETRPNVLYRLAGTPAEPFEQVYRIVV